MRKFFAFIWEITKMVVISLAIIIPIRYFLVQPFYVKGASMEPNFHDNEYLIIDEISYRFNEPQRGEIIVFRYPEDPKEYFIKRIIGLPGESVEINNGDIYIYDNNNLDGYKLTEPYLDENLKTTGSRQKIEVPAGAFYVLGDNRNASKDSRVFGPISYDYVIGRVFFRGWPFDKISTFPQVEYSY
ncbi:MAG: signal peptidase I [bacterium]